MRDKIFSKLVAKYPGLNKKFLGQLADKLAVKVTEEDKIEGALTELDTMPVSITDLANEFQKEGDRRVNEAKTEWEKKNPPAGGGKTGDTKDDDPEGKGNKTDDDAPAWAKAMMDEFKTLKAEKIQSSIKDKVAVKLKDKVPASYFKGRTLPDSEDKLDDFVKDVETDYEEHLQELTNKGLISDTKPFTASGGNVNLKVIEKDIDDWVKTTSMGEPSNNASATVPGAKAS